MIDNDNFKSVRDDLYGTFDRSFIDAYGRMIHGLAFKFYKRFELEGKVFFDEEIFSSCLIDMLVDLERLKYFHELENISFERLISYAASWIIKRKPFQIADNENAHKDNRCRFINEKFAFFLLMIGFGFDTDRYKVDADKTEKVKNIFKRINYHLRYRNTSPRTLELLLYGIECGACLN